MIKFAGLLSVIMTGFCLMILYIYIPNKDFYKWFGGFVYVLNSTVITYGVIFSHLKDK